MLKWCKIIHRCYASGDNLSTSFVVALFSMVVCCSFVNSTEIKEAINNRNIITEINIGNKDAQNEIEIYISPSCLHCGQFIADDLEKFMRDCGDKAKIVLKFLPTSAKDIFIMKLLQNETKDERAYFSIFKNYIKRAIATINFVKPTKKQLILYRGSNQDPEMIKFQVVASEFGFSDQKIVNAYPDHKMTQPFERTIMQTYEKSINEITKLVKTKQLDLPLIVRNQKIYTSLHKILE